MSERRALSVILRAPVHADETRACAISHAGIPTRVDTPVVVDASGSNVTVNVDVASWFRSSTGATIAPAPENASLIASRIQQSFRASEDDDRDGEDSDSDSDSDN